MPENYVDPYFKELFGGKTPQEVAAEITSLMPAAMADIDPAFSADYAPYTSKESIQKVINTVASTPGASKKLFNYQTFGATNRDSPYLSGMAFGDEYGKSMVDYGLMTNVANEINKTGEKQFVLDNLPAIVAGYSEGYGGNLKDFVDAFPSIGFTQADMPAIEKGYNQGLKDQAYIKSISTPFTIKHGFGSMVSGALNTARPILNNPLTQIALAYYMPGLVGQFAPSLGALGITSAAAQTAVANAIVSTAVQVAQGVPFDKAFQSAVTNAVVSTGSPAIAKDINKIIENPAVTDAIVSAGASAAKTAASGGSQSDIERNLVAGLVGSGTASATGSNIAGSAAAGGVTSGVTGALTGAASAYGAQLEAERIAAEKAAAGEFVSGINLAAADTGTVTDAGGGVLVPVSGTPIFADSPRASSVKPPFGFAVMPIEMADNKPSGAYFDYTQNAWIAPTTDIEKFTTLSQLDVANAGTGVVAVAPGIDLTQTTTTPPPLPPPTDTYNPNIVTTPSIGTTGGTSVSAPVTPTPVSPDKPILDLIAPTLPIAEPVKPVTPKPVIPEPTPVQPVIPTPVAPLPVIPTPVEPIPVTAVTPVKPTPVAPAPTPIQPVTPVPVAPTPITPTLIEPILPAPITSVVTPTGPITDREVIDVMQPPAPIVEPSLPPVTVIGTKEPTIQDTDTTLPVTTVIGKSEEDNTLGEVTVTGKKEEDTLPEVTVIGEKEEEPIAEASVEEKPLVDDKGKPYRPNLFIYGGTKPSTLSQTLGTNLPSARTTTGTSVGLGTRGEIESKESGKKRQTVWNEESLRLKDALGL